MCFESAEGESGRGSVGYGAVKVSSQEKTRGHCNRVSCWVTAYKMIQGGKTEEMQETMEDIWAMGYSVIGGIIGANTPLSWKFRLFEREELTGST